MTLTVSATLWPLAIDWSSGCLVIAGGDAADSLGVAVTVTVAVVESALARSFETRTQ